MPYFAWSGIDLAGKIFKGKQFARSYDVLVATLLKQEIAVLQARPLRAGLSRSGINRAQTSFFRYMATLLHAGIRLYDALLIVQPTITHRYVKAVIEDSAQAVQEGIPLSKACAYHDQFFSSFTSTIIQAGEDAGCLPATLERLARYCEHKELFAKKMRSASLVPCLTLCFFLLISGMLFYAVVPRFEALCSSSSGNSLPALTQAIFAFSRWLRSYAALGAFGILIGTAYSLTCIVKSPKVIYYGQILAIKTPLFRFFVYDSSLMFFLDALSLLLRADIHLLKALESARTIVANEPIRNMLHAVKTDVEAGLSLELALRNNLMHSSPELEALVKVGEASGSLAHMLGQAAEFYRERVNKFLSKVTELIQPLMLIILGLLIALLMGALYMPLLHLAGSIE